jgi:FtsP/CotA-like multicopper oxidase with cupredoxin domain
MQVIEAGEKPIEQPTWQDVVNVPARSNVTVRILFDDFTGRSVHHCYILDDEDLGMMGVIDVRR